MSLVGGNTSGFMNNLRSNFSKGGGLTMSAVNSSMTQAVQSAQLAPPAQSTSPAQPIQADVIVPPLAAPPKNTQLNVAEQVLSEFAQVVPQTITAVVPDPLNPPNPTPVGQAKKEVYKPGPALAEAPAPTPEYPAGVQAVEQEKTPEISPEVESFMQRAEQQPDQLPQEIVIADNQEISSVAHHPKQPVVVLPITVQDQVDGKNKDYKFSIRWLVEWSVKIMKKFSGKVIYREET